MQLPLEFPNDSSTSILLFRQVGGVQGYRQASGQDQVCSDWQCPQALDSRAATACACLGPLRHARGTGARHDGKGSWARFRSMDEWAPLLELLSDKDSALRACETHALAHELGTKPLHTLSNSRK